MSSNSNLHSLLKQQIRDAVVHIYDEAGTAADNRYSKPEELAKALLDILFPTETEINSQITGVINVPTTADADSGSESTGSKERKKRAPMSDEAKAAMKAKREATLAAKKAAPVPVPAPVEVAAPVVAAPVVAAAPVEVAEDKKERKPRGPMSDEAKAAMKAKREATLAAKKAAVA
jgi:hypothetical protein